MTHKELALTFGCSATTIARRLRNFGLRTKPWSERRHSEESKRKLSHTRVSTGIAVGEKNPNFGKKDRPWLEGDRHPFRVWHKENPDFGKLQRGEANPVHKVRHFYKDPKYLRRITRGIRAHVDQKRGSTYEEVYGLEKALSYKSKLRAVSPGRLAKMAYRETTPERLIRESLERIGVSFEAQAPLGPYTVDFLVPSLDLVIQADGDFWHANPQVYADKALSPRQRKQRRLDASCNSFLANRGYHVLRIWERDLKRDATLCAQAVEKLLEKQHG